MTLTYLGTLDDVVDRYPWGYKIDLAFLNRTLIRAALFGDKILINDGYLMQLRAAREAIMNPERSPLLRLVQLGRIHVLTRSDDLAKMPEEMKDAGVTSYADLVDSSDWLKLQRQLGSVERDLRDWNAKRAWPDRDMGAGFRDTILLAQNKKPDELGLTHVDGDLLARALDLFGERMQRNTQAARTKWEDSAREAVKKQDVPDPDASLANLMFLGNQSYHINFAGCLSATGNEPVAVETFYSPAVTERLEYSDTQVTSIAGAFLGKIPDDFPINDSSKLAELFQVSGPLGEYRQQYLDTLRAYALRQAGIDDLRSAAELYQKYLSTHFYKEKDALPRRDFVDFATAAGLFLLEQTFPSALSPIETVAIFVLLHSLEKHIPPYVTQLLKLDEKTRTHEFFDLNKSADQPKRVVPAFGQIKMMSQNLTSRALEMYKKLPTFR